MSNPTSISIQMPAVNAAGAIKELRLLWGTTKGGPYPYISKIPSPTPDANGLVKVSVAALVLQVALPDVATVYAVAVADAANGVTSDQTGEVSFSLNYVKPNPPAGLTVS